MKLLWCLGDLHFSTSRDWDSAVFSKFIDWFEKFDFGNKIDCELIQLGDVVERASNLGDTLELVTKFFNICCNKFKTTYIIGGNHDHKTLYEKSQYATQFLPYLGSIKTIYKEEIFTTSNGFEVLALPFRRVAGKVLDDYYSNELPTEFYKAKVHLICGHVALKEPKTFYGGITISKFKPSVRAFGHIHTRNGIYKEDYVGSVVPLKIDEKDTELPRVMRCLNIFDGKVIVNDTEIPQFVQYDYLQFGETPKYTKSSDLVHIYTINNCKNIQQAKTQYPNIYIRGVEKIHNTINVKTGEKVEHFISPLHALDNLIVETKMVIKRKTHALLKALLS